MTPPHHQPRSLSRLVWLALLLPLTSGLARGQVASESPDSAANKPLPDIATLMHEVEAKQHTVEAIEKDYIFRESVRTEELDSHGGTRKTVTREFENYWIDGVNVRRMVKKDGKDLSPEEQKKESDRIDKEVQKGRERKQKAEAEGRETDPDGRDELTVSRILELGTFTSERRELINGRPTIIVDFAGDPKAKTHTQLEGIVHELAGTAWIDETDKLLSRLDGRFAHPFRIGGGLLVNVQEGTSFSFHARKVNDEVWLPDSLDAQGKARFLLFASFDGKIQARFGDYRKFKATTKILPGVTEVEGTAPTEEERPK